MELEAAPVLRGMTMEELDTPVPRGTTVEAEEAAAMTGAAIDESATPVLRGTTTDELGAVAIGATTEELELDRGEKLNGAAEEVLLREP